jgi:hypothetical protein
VKSLTDLPFASSVEIGTFPVESGRCSFRKSE